MTLQDSLLEQIEQIPEVLEKVNKARERLHLSSNQCPCAPKEDGRGCVGPVCMQEILTKYRCHCGAYRIKEVWKDIEGFEGLYQVSNYGNVKSLDRIVKNKGLLGASKECLVKGRLLGLKRINHSRGSAKGYILVALHAPSKRKNIQVHRLVAQAFIPNPDNKPFVDHINGDTHDNRVCNLRWVTCKENNGFLRTRLNNSKYRYKGDTAINVARKNGIKKCTFESRIHNGWTVEDACTKSVTKKKGGKRCMNGS